MYTLLDGLLARKMQGLACKVDAMGDFSKKGLSGGPIMVVHFDYFTHHMREKLDLTSHLL